MLLSYPFGYSRNFRADRTGHRARDCRQSLPQLSRAGDLVAALLTQALTRAIFESRRFGTNGRFAPKAEVTQLIRPKIKSRPKAALNFDPDYQIRLSSMLALTSADTP